MSCEFFLVKRYVFQKALMYTVFDFVIYTKKSNTSAQKLIDTISSELCEFEYHLSPGGKGILADLNRTGSLKREVNPEIFDLIARFIRISKDIHQKSNGAFDLTVYPLVRLWGFYIQDDERVPDAKEIKDIISIIGMEKVTVTDNEILLSKNVQLDFGAIAKGFAVDYAINALQKDPLIKAGFVNAGGTIRVFGIKPDGVAWKVGIRNPNGDQVEEIVDLKDGESIATSGNYEQFFVRDGKYYHHIFNPKTGYPTTHSLASVSVILSTTAEEADVLATTVLSLGKDKTLEFISAFPEYQTTPLFFIERSEDILSSEGNTFWNNLK